MITIVEPKEHIARLWGKQKVRESDTYRLMRYVLRVDHEGKVLLHNVVTGQLVVLSEEEARALDQLPSAYTPTMEQLVSEHYLVPETFDEHRQVVNLKKVLEMLEATHAKPGIDFYTILPTTACNARCYYCFEQGCRTATMTEQTADEVVDFIDSHRIDDRKISITWFGGEPTVAANRIDQISEGLQKRNVQYVSMLITNGYLFDEEMVKKAKTLWHTNSLQICVDGTEESYNKIKAYVGAKDNPYQRVMRNIELLLENEILVGLRMNYDLQNWREFSDILEEVDKRFGRNPYLAVGTHEIVGEYKDSEGHINHGDDEWLTDMQLQMREKTIESGFRNTYKALPYLGNRYCCAYKESAIVITPEGNIVKCPEQFGDDQIIGHVTTGIVNHELERSWKQIADYPMCVNCPLFPDCTRIVHCRNKTFCHRWKVFMQECKENMILNYRAFFEGGNSDGISGANCEVCSY